MSIETKSLVVAVAGHRWNRMDQRQEQQLTEALAACFVLIDSTVSRRPVRLLTGLAEGGDQVAALAMPAHWRLSAVLPMPQGAYERHLRVHGTGDPAEAISRLRALLQRPGTSLVDADLGSPEAGYLAIQNRMIEEANLLVAIWDGKAGAGRGGTADTIARALGQGMPVLWIPADRNENGALQRVVRTSNDGTLSSTPLNASHLTRLIAASGAA